MIGQLEDDSTGGSPRSLLDESGSRGLVVGSWAVSSVRGRHRQRNEDASAQLGPVFAVADGMGGLSAGDAASALGASIVVHEWLSLESSLGIAGPQQAVRMANERIRERMQQTGERIGCTLSAVRISNDRALVLHVGDSRVYRVRDGSAELLTRDHNLRAELLAAGIAPLPGDPLGPPRALTSYLGMESADLQIDIRSVTLHDRDRLVLCSDGVFTEMTHAQLAELASLGTTETAAARLTSHLGPDDSTALVIEIAQDSDPRGMS